MGIDELEAKIKAIRDRPLQLLCLMPSGKIRRLTVCQCWEAGARFVHVDCTELDELLGRELGGDDDAIADNRRNPQMERG